MTPPPKRFAACIMATAVVPWTADFRLDEARFRSEIGALLQAGYRHLYVFGTAGEGYAVDEAQFQHVARVFVHEMRAAGAEPIVGVISLSLATILQRIAYARDVLGVRFFQISLPGWGALQGPEVTAFFDAVLGRFGDCQFLHYNLLRTNRLVSAAEYAVIAANHPNLVATKNSTDSMSRIRDLLDRAPMLQHFLNERGFAYGSLVSECGLLISIATVNWRMGQRYFQAGRRRDVSLLMHLEGELSRIATVFAQVVGGGSVRIDGAYDKTLYRLHDEQFPVRLLPPYAGPDPAAVDRFATWLRAEYADWAPEPNGSQAQTR